MIDPKPGDQGRRVIYTESGSFPGRKIDTGVISSWTDRYVFVYFGSGESAVATDRANLTWWSA